MNEPETDTGVFKRTMPQLVWLLPLRRYLTPKSVWAAIVALAFAIGYVVHAQINLSSHQESITSLQKERAQDRELLQKIDTQLAVMNIKIGDIALEVDRQREWRERIEDVAEAPPHARRRTR